MKQETKQEWWDLSRKERGQLIAKTLKIVKTDKGWLVPSQRENKTYLVKFNGHEPECNCPDCELRKKKCKHIYAVEFYIKQEIDQEGNITLTKGMRVTYPQVWKAYDTAQTNEGLLFMQLLNDICGNVEQPLYKFGRPTLPISDMIFSSVMKVYSTFSLRRFMSDIKIAQEKGYLSYVPCYSSVGHFLQDETLTPILKDLIRLSSMPLKNVETKFAVDSTGFSTSRFARWFDHKYGKDVKQRIWLKAHVISGCKTNIITSCEITEGHANDCPELPKLVTETAENFKLEEVTGDKAYSSRENLKVIEEVGATPFIPFKSNVTGKRGALSIWGKMYHYFMYRHEEFLQHYHYRSNVESVFNMIKSKFKDNLRSKTETAQINELLCKVLAHNICVVIQEMIELGIQATFCVESQEGVYKVNEN